MAGGHLPLAAVLAEELSDAEATRRVFLTAGGLLVIALVLLVATVWWWRATRPDHPVLAPLEVMSERRWAKAGVEERRRMIESSRPAGSLPAVAEIAGPEPVDLSVLVATESSAPDDLAELDRLLGLVPDENGDGGHAPAGAGPGYVDEIAAAGASEDAANGPTAPANREEEPATATPASDLDDARDDRERDAHTGSAESAAELFESDAALSRRHHDADPDDGERGAIDPLLQRTSVVAKD